MIPHPLFEPKSSRQIRLCCGMITQEKPVLTIGKRQIKLNRVSFDITPPEEQFFLHAHAAYELIILLDGKARFIGQGEDQSLGRGTIFLFAPLVQHAWRVLEARCVKFAVTFSVEPAIAIPLPASWPVSETLAEDVESMGQEILETTPQEQFYLSSRILAIVSHALSIVCPQQALPVPSNRKLDLAEEVEQLLLQNISLPLTLREIAAHLGMSVRHLTRTFRQVAGETVNSFIMRTRMHHARFLLQETDKKVTEIGKLVGIAEPGYFHRCFRRFMGVTPMQYRRLAAGTRN